MSDLSQRLQQLHLVHKAATSMTTAASEGEYVIHIDIQTCAACGSDAKIAASASDCSVRLYSKQCLAYSHMISDKSDKTDASITGIKFSRTDPNLLYAASQGSSVKSWDLRNKGSKAVCSYGDSNSCKTVSSFDLCCDEKFLCVGSIQPDDENQIQIWDVRQRKQVTVYTDCHLEEITKVSYHPSRPEWLLSGSMDGLICLFNTSESNDDDALQTVYNCESAVYQMGWCGKNYNDVYGLTYNHSVHIWDTDQFDVKVDIQDLGPEREDCSVDYLVDMLQLSDTELYLLAGSFSDEAGLSVLRIQDSEIVPCLSSMQGHTGVVRCCLWDQTERTLVTGGEDSMLCLWRMGENALPTETKVKSKGMKMKPNEKERHKSLKSDRPKKGRH